MIEVAGILIRRGKAFLPTKAKAGPGTYIEVEPISIVDVTMEAITAMIERMMEAGHPPSPPITKEFWQQRKDPMLAATGVKSWSKLAKDSASYSIDWSQDQITLYMSRLDKKGRFEADPDKTRYFSPDTPLQMIVQAIIADVATRPEMHVN
jgi:hypothetical protein